MKTMDIERLNELETIDPRPLPPWRLDPFAEIEIGSDRETATQKAETTRSTSDIVVYSDASGRQDHLGAAVVALDDNHRDRRIPTDPGRTDGPLVCPRSGAHRHLLRDQHSLQDRPPTLKNSRQANDSDDPV